MTRKSIFLILSLSLLFSADYDKIPLLKWAGPPGSRPETYEEWIAQHPYTDFYSYFDKIVYGDGRLGTVVILTQQSIASALASKINQLINNLQSEGYTVLSYEVSGGTPETLRTFLRSLYNNNNIEGVFFIGNLPVCWFEIKNDFNQYGYADFPIDLFYMDLDGTWLDTMNTGNGKYDGHFGNIDPEIYVGRLTTTGIGTDTVLLKNYFRKDNAYRHDTLELWHRALVFVDDDWIPWAPEWATDVSLLYPDTMNFWHAETTRASVYRVKLDTPQAWVSVFAHSWPGGHCFYYNNGNQSDYYYSTEYTTQNPPANFYNHFACSFARYTTNGYGSGRSVFNQDYGLGAIGSTKTGSMLDFYYFYNPLANGKTLGAAFKDWFMYITSNGVSFDELCWHYGMTLLSDPFLKPTGHGTGITEANVSMNVYKNLEIYGNLSNSSIQIRLNIDKPERVSIIAYDCAGRKVKVLLAEGIIYSPTQFFWSFTDENGNSLHAGVYLIRAKIGTEIYCRKLIKI